ncbi:MAG: hypothetical protein QM681_11560 [Novosphingobium sp.]
MRAQFETAACLWEAVLEFRDSPVPDAEGLERACAIRRACAVLGTAALRLLVVGWVDPLEAAWRSREGDFPLAFDWDFVPRWIAERIDWSDPSNPSIDVAKSGRSRQSDAPMPGLTVSGCTHQLAIEEGRYCVLSTAHLTVQTADLLDRWASWPPSDRPIDIAASVYGWFVPVYALTEECRARLPDDLLRLIAFGRERFFQFLLLDCDGERFRDLPVHTW